MDKTPDPNEIMYTQPVCPVCGSPDCPGADMTNVPDDD